MTQLLDKQNKCWVSEQFSISYYIAYTEIVLLRFHGSFLTNAVPKLEQILALFTLFMRKTLAPGDEITGGQLIGDHGQTFH